MVSFTKLAVAATAAAGVSAQTAPSICDKYTTALLKNNTAENQYTLLTLLVKTAALGSFTGPGTKLASLPGSMVKVPGILAPGMVDGQAINLMPYFTGELATTNVNGMPAGVNWLDADTNMLVSNATYVGEPGSRSATLLSHLFQYFGAALGCSTYGQTGFPKYGGDASQQNVHKFMDLNHAQVMWFIQQVGLSAKSFGASDADITTVANLLTKVFNYRCSPPTTVIPEQGAQLQSICQDASCPLDPAATCAAYAGDYTASSQVKTASATGAPKSSASGNYVVSMIGDGQPQAPTSPAAPKTSATAVVSMISDGQPQAPKATGTPAAAKPSSATAASATARYTGAAVANSVSGAVAGVAGLFAFLL